MGGGENDSEASHDWAGGQLRQGPPPIAVTRRMSYEWWRREWLQGQPRLGGGQLRQGPPAHSGNPLQGRKIGGRRMKSGECKTGVLFVVKFMSFPLTIPICIKVQLGTNITLQDDIILAWFHFQNARHLHGCLLAQPA
jgi:hypothetical protein